MKGTNNIRQVVRRGPNIKTGVLWLLADNRLDSERGFRIHQIDVFLINCNNTESNQQPPVLGSGKVDGNGRLEFAFHINTRKDTLSAAYIIGCSNYLI